MKNMIVGTLTSTLCTLGFLHLNSYAHQNTSNPELKLVWDSYKDSQMNDPIRKNEFETKKITFNNHTMKYECSVIGAQPENGYPLYIALHGGGGAPSYLNDSQWQHMKIYYRDSVKNGVYCAPRGVTDTWDLHFRPESYVMYDRFIENMILFQNVDPNRVYVLGFSAGGDGVYQIAPRMSDRFAAANMSAGHHNWINIWNLYNLPFLIQVGANDGMYSRNKADAEYCVKLEQIAKTPGSASYECNIHAGRGHNFLDNDATRTPQSVFVSPEKWLNENDTSTELKNTNAIDFLNKFTRNPLPEHVYWDLKTRAPRSGVDNNGLALWKDTTHGQQHYWLDIAHHTNETLGTDEILVHLDKSRNAVVIEKGAKYLKLLLKESMLDFSKPVTIETSSYSTQITVVKNPETLKKTLAQRGDVNYAFDAEVVVELTDSGWRVSQVE